MPTPRSNTPRSHVVLSALTASLLWTHSILPSVSATVIDSLEQGFLFDWSGDQSPPIPIAAQCNSLPITWGRRSAIGPNPVAPYYLQVYTSTFIVPFVIPAGSGQSFDWPVPFVPGTQFQICMMASNGVTGGCQQIYTVYQAPGTTLENPPTCQNLTYPHGALDVSAMTSDNTWSTFGWIDQCTDISITPKNGTPPFTYTISPTLRPVINFTSDSMETVNWTVNLAYGLPFWVTVADSTNSTWTNGPLHASNGSTSCLSQDSNDTDSKVLSVGGAVGVGIGALVAGLVAGAIGAFLFFRRREAQGSPYGGVALRRKSSEPLVSTSLGFSAHSPSTSDTFTHTRNSRTTIDPYLLPQEDFALLSPNPPTSPPNTISFSTTSGDRPPLSPSHTHAGSMSSNRSTYPPLSPTEPPAPVRPPFGQSGSAQHVYVVHHDGGRPPPVTVFTSDGAEVVELPPQYAEADRGGPSRPSGSTFPVEQQRRAPRALPQKSTPSTTRFASNPSES